MRTTIILDDSLAARLKAVIPHKKMSDLINRCLREYFEREEHLRRLKELEKAYLRAAGKRARNDDFDLIDREDWPEW